MSLPHRKTDSSTISTNSTNHVKYKIFIIIIIIIYKTITDRFWKNIYNFSISAYSTNQSKLDIGTIISSQLNIYPPLIGFGIPQRSYSYIIGKQKKIECHVSLEKFKVFIINYFNLVILRKMIKMMMYITIYG